MTDIVERLRVREVLSIKQDGYIHSLPINPDGDDGAAEIERLRAENETLRRDVKTAVMGDSAELADMKRENEKLRRAMHDIYEVYAGSEGDLKQAEGYYLLCLITEMSGIAAEHKK